MHGTARSGRLNVVEITRVVCVIPTLCLKLEQLLCICCRVSRHCGRVRLADGRTFVERLVIRREVRRNDVMGVAPVLTVDL